MKYKSLRTKILIIVISLTLTMLFVANIYNYFDRKELLYNVSIEKLLILTKAMNLFEKKQFEIYKGRVKALQNDKYFISLLNQKNNNSLNLHMTKIRQIFKASTPYLIHLHIFDLREKYIYNAHSKQTNHNDNFLHNTVLQQAKINQKITSGYVVLKSNNYYYSIVSPIKADKKVIAYIEFGIKADNLFKIASKSGRYKYALYLNTSKQQSGKRDIGQLVASNSKLFKELDINQSFIYKNANNNHIIQHNNKYYLFNQYDIETPFQKNFAQVLMASNVTKYVVENRNKTLYNFLISLVLLIIMYFSIYMIITKIIQKLIADEDILSAQKTQMQVIIDNNHSLVALFQGNKLTIANKSFLTFFQSTTLENFKKKNVSLDSLFIQSEGSYVSKNIHNNLHWIHNLQTLSIEKRVVAFKKNENNLYFFSVQINHVPNQNNHNVIVFTDISKVYTQSKKDQYLANHDTLTKIFNRQSFNEKIATDIINQNINTHKSSLLMFDLDFFKRVNDTYGHQVGDNVLIQFTKIITNNIRDNDVFARWGGEEFVLLLIGTPISTAITVANNLRQRVQEDTFAQVGTITCSVGISKYIIGDSTEEWLSRVDEALYKAKENGRNKVEVI